MQTFAPGQRWMSETEPELGLGVVSGVDGHHVSLLFAACGERRTYATADAPVVRVRFENAERIALADGRDTLVAGVREENSVLVYSTELGDVPECELGAHLVATRPETRLLRGATSPPALFDLRCRTLRLRQTTHADPTRGIIGGRVVLLPHQLHVVSEVFRRPIPRVMLADEVGLGKTIEACLIVHRLLVTGRITRVLVVLPESLIHQWFVELLRRFSICAAVYDEGRCAALEANPGNGNPFADAPVVLCPLELLAGKARRAEQAHAAGWDLVVVDEAHHLGWTQDCPSTEFLVVEALARASPGLLLLTATPEQVGPESHFARLRLLDPGRYPDLQRYRAESANYERLVPLAEALATGAELGEEERKALTDLGIDPAANPADQLRAVLDRHGPGRVIFRNTRKHMKQFPRRHAELHALPQGGKAAWVARFVRETAPEKALLICETSARARALAEDLLQHTGAGIALFHEDLSIVQRDRQAAWFAEEGGAQLLIASAIGGEGRNFQFCHRLILYDLPPNPEVLEQRIGRLDRIGQTHDIELHVPFEEGSLGETLAHWYREALDAFDTPLVGGYQIYQLFGREVEAAAGDCRSDRWSDLVERTRRCRETIRGRLLHGSNRLLELQSCDEKDASRLLRAVRRRDADPALETYALELFEHFGIHSEAVSAHTYALKPEHLFTDAFPGMPEEGLTATFDRERALAREDYHFLTWDHPMVTGAMDLLLLSHDGAASQAFWPAGRGRALLLEAVFVLESHDVAGGETKRFLPPTPIRVLVDHEGVDHSGDVAPDELSTQLVDGRNHPVLEKRQALAELLPSMLGTARTLAEASAPKLLRQARRKHRDETDAETTRLQALRRVNPHVSEEEIQAFRIYADRIADGIASAAVRLDSVRLIWRE